MIFRRLSIANWRQFREIDFEFHPRLTVLTGANGAGKTTVLNLLSRHFGWRGTLVSTPRRAKSGTEFSADYWTEDHLQNYELWLRDRTQPLLEPPEYTIPEGPPQQIGNITYWDNRTAALTVPPKVGVSFQINIGGERSQHGLHIPSHRPIFSHQSVENIPTAPRRRDQAFKMYTEIIRNRYYGGHHQRTPNYFMKETLLALAAFGYGNQVIDPDPESLETFTGFQEVLRKVLPPSLGFLQFAVRLPEVVLITKSGDFSLDGVSGGVSSLIDLAWQIFMYATPDTPFAVTLDEPENHLHPELQRTVLGTFLLAFPNVQFICATHNPFIVTSVPDSHTYALRYGQDHRVRSELLSAVDRSGSSNETLRDVLGLPSTSPTWVDDKLKEVEDLLADRELTEALIIELQERLRALGIERFIPATLARLARRRLTL